MTHIITRQEAAERLVHLARYMQATPEFSRDAVDVVSAASGMVLFAPQELFDVAFNPKEK